MVFPEPLLPISMGHIDNWLIKNRRHNCHYS